MACTDPHPPPRGSTAQKQSILRVGPTYPAARVAFVLVDTGSGVGLTIEEATRLVQGPAPPGQWSLREFVHESSYGTQTLQPEVLGPFPYTIDDSCNAAGVVTGLRSMIDATAGGAFNHYIWYLGRPVQACSWSQQAEVGTPDRPANDGWMNGVLPCGGFVSYGRNVGMLPSSLLRCGATPFADEPNVGCTETIAGDPFDASGAGCGHPNVWQKAHAGWLLACNGVRSPGAGTFTLLPVELPCDGVQLLQVPMPKQRLFSTTQPGPGGVEPVEGLLSHYYLELRTGRGADTGLSPVVQVRVSGDLRSRQQRGFGTWILDLNPATADVDGIKSGETFSDPAGGVSFTVTELDDTHAQVTVTIDGAAGPPTCLDGTTMFSPPGPGIGSCDPAPARMPGAGGAQGGGAGSGGRGGALGTGASGGTAGGGSSGMGVSDGAAGTPAPDAAGLDGAGGTAAGGSPGDGAAGGASGRAGHAEVQGCGCEMAEAAAQGDVLLLLAALAGAGTTRFRRRWRERAT
jgi:MYXO-CTERM domain-containing protein